jgi:hypothetical protein
VIEAELFGGSSHALTQAALHQVIPAVYNYLRNRELICRSETLDWRKAKPQPSFQQEMQVNRASFFILKHLSKMTSGVIVLKKWILLSTACGHVLETFACRSATLRQHRFCRIKKICIMYRCWKHFEATDV